LTSLVFLPAASVASDDKVAFVCSGIHRTNLFDSGTNVTGVSVIIDLDKRIVQTPVGLLPIVLMNENKVDVQTDVASGSIDRQSGKARFSQYPKGVLMNQYDLLCSKA
jgi:hypothetical protein